MTESYRRRAVVLGLLAVAGLWMWQFLTVHYNYGGNWTALFCIRPGMPVPVFLKSEHLYIFYGTEGYDGQVYHLIAHDPWMRRGSAPAIAGAAFRYQRILVPALAWMLALGQDQWIHRAYFTVVLGFAFAGVYWLALLASHAGLDPAWGLVFVLTPATITSIDRMTVDIALAALTVGFAIYVEMGARWKVVAVLACAALTRETALPIIAGYALYLFTRRRFFDGVCAAAAILPAAGWYIYLSRRAEPSPLPSYVNWVPLAGLADRVFHPVIYALPPFKAVPAIVFDYIALAGIAMTLIFVARLAVKRQWDAESAPVYALAIAAIFLSNRSVWEDAYAFGRVLTPLMLLAALPFLAAQRRAAESSNQRNCRPPSLCGYYQGNPRPCLAFAPLFLVDARIGLNLASQLLGIIRGLLK